MTTIFMSPFLVLGTWYLGIGTSPPWSGSGTGEYRRRRGGGASEASQETTVISLRSYGPRPLGTSCHSPTPLTASWGRNPRPQRQGRPTPLPRGAAAEQGSTAGGGEGARAKRARNPTVDSLRSYGPRPLRTSCHSPTPLTASWGRNPLRQRRHLPPSFAWGTNPQQETPPPGDRGVHRYQGPT